MPQSTGFSRHARRARLRRRPAGGDRRRRGHARLRLQRGHALRERYRAIDEAFGGYPHALHYALKANSTLAIARLLRELGSAADANSVWEIEVAREAGFPPSAIVFTGVGKSPAELETRWRSA